MRPLCWHPPQADPHRCGHPGSAHTAADKPCTPGQGPVPTLGQPKQLETLAPPDGNQPGCPRSPGPCGGHLRLEWWSSARGVPGVSQEGTEAMCVNIGSAFV